MTAVSPETEIEILKVQTKTLHGDLSEMKDDIKVIKELLSSKFVTKEEFSIYQQNAEQEIREAKKVGVVKTILTSLLTAVVVGIVMFEVGRAFK